MDLSTIIGIVLGFALIVWGIKIPQLPNFWDPQSLALTLGGTVAAVVASFPFSQLKRMGSHFKILVQGGRYNYGALIEQMVEMAQLARQNGLLSLEEKANEIDDPPRCRRSYLREGRRLCTGLRYDRYSGRSGKYVEEHECGRGRGKLPWCGYVRGPGYYLLRLYYSKSFDVSHSQEAAYPQRRGDAVPYDYDGGYYLHSGR